MSSKTEQIKAALDFRRVLEAAQERRLIWIHRPIYIHDRNPGVADNITEEDILDFDRKPPADLVDPATLPKCPCRCGSRLARVVAAKRYIDVLIDRYTGERRVFSDLSPEGQKKFAILCWSAERIDMPLRCSRKQYAFFMARPKVKVAFGGARGGKTTISSEELVDEFLRNGGRGAQLWVVSATREKTQIMLRKLVEGETVGAGKLQRQTPPIIPKCLVRHVPASERSPKQYIGLLDGTKIYLKYASRKGGNLKGDPPQFVAVDELCTIDHIENFQQILDRLLESGGRMVGATTPVAGHWAEEVLYRKGVELDRWDREFASKVWINLTCLDNPWVNPWFVRDTIKVKDNNKNVRRELLGEWVSDGEQMWTEYDPVMHLYRGHGRSCEDYGLKNITSTVAKRFFRNSKGKLDRVAGMDFDFWPMSLIVAQVATIPGLDETDPDNWILFVEDEVIKRVGTIIEFADFLSTKAGRFNGRGQRGDFFDGLAIACDPSGAQHGHHYQRTMGADKGSTLAKEMKRAGFDCRPAHVGKGGKPYDPPLMDSCSLMHRLMTDRVRAPEGVRVMGGRTELPRLLVHEDRCPVLIHSLETQESDARNLPRKETHFHDRKAGPTDALRYLAWPLFYRATYTKAVKVSWQ